MTEPTTQPANGQPATAARDDVRSVVSEMLDAHARSQRVERSFLDDLDKYEKISKTVTNTVALPEWIRGEWLKQDNGPKLWKPRAPAEQEKIALSVIMAGAELGISPMVSIRMIYLVEGKVGLAAELMLALVIRAGVRIKWVATTAEKATLWLHRAGHDPHEHTFTYEEAKKAELTNKFNWKGYAPAMLRARAASAGIRAYCPDITNGCYSKEEMEDLAEDLRAQPPTSLDQIAAMGAPAQDEQPPAVKLIALIKQVANQEEYRLAVADANYLSTEMDAAEKQAVKLALDAAAARLTKAGATAGA